LGSIVAGLGNSAPVNANDHAHYLFVVVGIPAPISFVHQSAGHDASLLEAGSHNSVSQTSHRITIFAMLLLGWAGASVVSTLTAEATLATTSILLGLSNLTGFNLFPEPAVTPGDFILIGVLNLGSLVDPGDPLSGSVGKLIFRAVNAILLSEALNSGVGFFDLWATSAVVPVLTTLLALISAITHVSLSLTYT
jgi:hypothetical protein